MKRVWRRRAWCARIQARVWRSTQRSIRPMRPLFSAAVIRRGVGTLWPAASRMRSSTSKLSERSGSRSDMMGCISRYRPCSSSDAVSWPASSISASCSCSARESCSNTTRWLPLLCLASRQARSAVEIASLAELPGAASIKPTEPRT